MSEIKYTIYRTRRKNLMLKLKNDGSLALYCPKGYPKYKALEFLNKNAAKMSVLAKERQENRLSTVFGEDLSRPTLLYFGKRYPVLYGVVKKLTFREGMFFAPENVPTEALLCMYKNFLRDEAKRIIPTLTKELADKHGLSFSRIFIKDISSRYGSCSTKKNLNFSLALPAFNQSFFTFIILHELAHTVHFNHGSEFYQLLEKICPEHRLMETEFKKLYSPLLRAICS